MFLGCRWSTLVAVCVFLGCRWYTLVAVCVCVCFLFRSDLACKMAISAVKTVTLEKGRTQREIDIKRYARVEKVPGGAIEDSEVLRGVMFQKDVTHARMRR